MNTGPIAINATRGEGDTTSSVATTYSQKDVSVIGSDIRYIKTEDFDIEEKNSFLFGSTRFYLVYAIGVLVFIGLFLFRKRKARENADIALAKNRKANKYAKKRLKEASKHLTNGDKDRFYEETLHALWGYLSDKLGIPVSELSRDNAKDKLSRMKIDEGLIEKLLKLIDDCEFARYAPASDESRRDELYNEAIGVISKLQQKLK